MVITLLHVAIEVVYMQRNECVDIMMLLLKPNEMEIYWIVLCSLRKLNLKCIISVFVYHTTRIYKWILGFTEKIDFTEKIGVLCLFKNGESMKVDLGLRCINQMFGGFQSRGF